MDPKRAERAQERAQIRKAGGGHALARLMFGQGEAMRPRQHPATRAEVRRGKRKP